jgi:hypothetical protein
LSSVNSASVVDADLGIRNVSSTSYKKIDNIFVRIFIYVYVHKDNGAQISLVKTRFFENHTYILLPETVLLYRTLARLLFTLLLAFCLIGAAQAETIASEVDAHCDGISLVAASAAHAAPTPTIDAPSCTLREQSELSKLIAL